MKARGILMHARSIEGLLAGRKLQTRRIVKNPDYFGCLTGDCDHDKQADCDAAMRAACPYGVPGDLLWVRESFGRHASIREFRGWAADGWRPTERHERLAPSIHLPRAWSRLTLELTDVRVERVQDISEADALAEGIVVPPTPPEYCDATGERVLPYTRTARLEFIGLWNDTNGPGAWERNDWCWALTFKVHRLNVDQAIHLAMEDAP